ncbi:hypothetical protein ASPTUDRAFT_428281 [Aspergillus tubingensis CBS 134.48]|uniref:Uncharacterized protein n=1 Tax=Aspergillus tubingensis (strain CBS 134.48) TaxID=767770 RepID=A0A1L9NE65_ASPTC|nr:hypothetical protein ASPTUDRAFT_428281 [Aspergillus tubingensis CBS 134.48]
MRVARYPRCLSLSISMTEAIASHLIHPACPVPPSPLRRIDLSLCHGIMVLVTGHAHFKGHRIHGFFAHKVVSAHLQVRECLLSCCVKVEDIVFSWKIHLLARPCFEASGTILTHPSHTLREFSLHLDDPLNLLKTEHHNALNWYTRLCFFNLNRNHSLNC